MLRFEINEIEFGLWIPLFRADLPSADDSSKMRWIIVGNKDHQEINAPAYDFFSMHHDLLLSEKSIEKEIENGSIGFEQLSVLHDMCLEAYCCGKLPQNLKQIVDNSFFLQYLNPYQEVVRLEMVAKIETNRGSPFNSVEDSHAYSQLLMRELYKNGAVPVSKDVELFVVQTFAWLKSCLIDPFFTYAERPNALPSVCLLM